MYIHTNISTRPYKYILAPFKLKELCGYQNSHRKFLYQKQISIRVELAHSFHFFLQALSIQKTKAP